MTADWGQGIVPMQVLLLVGSKADFMCPLVAGA